MKSASSDEVKEVSKQEMTIGTSDSTGWLLIEFSVITYFLAYIPENYTTPENQLLQK